MAKFMQILFVAFLAVALCSAEPARNSRLHGKRSRFLARQELEEVTPYPSAKELKPEIPFDETMAAGEETTNVAGENTIGVDGDNTFGFTGEQMPFIPDEVYGPPEEEFPAVAHNVVPVEEEDVAVAEEEVPARLTARRGGVRKGAVRTAKLRKATPARRQRQ